jgi:PAS domain S-box-containing protein
MFLMVKSLWSIFLLIFLFSLQALSAKGKLESIDSIRNSVDSLEQPEIYRNYYFRIAKDNNLSFERRIKALEIVEKITRELCDNDRILRVLGHRGHIYRSKGSPALAIEAFSEGFKYLEEGSDDKLTLARQGWFLIAYGNLLYEFELFEVAMVNFKQALRKMSQKKTGIGMSVALNNIGLCHLGINNIDSALTYFTKSYDIRDTVGSDNLKAHSLIYISNVYLHRKENDRADSILKVARNYMVESENRKIEIDVLVGWAEIAISKEEYLEANDYLNNIADAADALNSLKWLITKIDVLKALEDVDSLLIYAEKGITLGKKLSNINIELYFLEAKIFGLSFDPSENSEVIKESIDLFISLRKTQAKVKDEVLRELFKANLEYIKIKAQNANLKLEDSRKTELIDLQTDSILLISIIIIILVIGFVIFYFLYQKISKTKNILAIIGSRTRVASDSMTIGIISFNSRNQLRFINRAGQEYFKSIGLDKIKLDSNLVNQIEVGNRRQEWKKRLESIDSEGNSQIINFELNAGVEHYYIYNITRILNSDGHYSGGIITINDITEIHQANIELAKKSKELKIANDSKDRMLSLLAHDLKEGVVSSLELTRHLKEGFLNEAEEKESVNLLEASLSKTSSLLFKTLDWVKDQQSETKSRRHDVILVKLIRDVERSLRDKILAKNLEIIYDIDLNLSVFIDSELIRSVLRNILTNAIKFSDKKNSKIEIFTEQDENANIVLHIKDFGIGLNSVELKKILNLDYHDSRQGSAGEKGTGMGLKLVQELLLSHGSLLQVHSVLNQGSDFYFRLPISKN